MYLTSIRAAKLQHRATAAARVIVKNIVCVHTKGQEISRDEEPPVGHTAVCDKGFDLRIMSNPGM